MVFGKFFCWENYILRRNMMELISSLFYSKKYCMQFPNRIFIAFCRMTCYNANNTS